MIIELPDSTEESVHDGHEFTVRKKNLNFMVFSRTQETRKSEVV